MKRVLLAFVGPHRTYVNVGGDKVEIEPKRTASVRVSGRADVAVVRSRSAARRSARLSPPSETR